MGIEEQLPGGILLSTVEKVAGLRPQELAVAGDVRAGLLRDRDDGHRRAAVRHRPLRDGAVLGDPTAGRSDDRGGAGQPEDGAGAASDLRPDGRAQSGCWPWACARRRGGMFNNYAIVQGVDHVVPVDIYLPGCPPRPEMLLHAILKLHDKIQEMPLGVNRERGHRRGRAGGAGGQAHHRDAWTAAMSSPDHDPKRAASEVGGSVADRRRRSHRRAPRHVRRQRQR